MNTNAIWLIAAAYLLGAVPFGFLIGLARGVDIRQHGSRNIGATNAGRVLGRKWGYLCLALDILKGFVPALLALQILVREPITAVMLWSWILVGLAAVLGHVFPIYLGFRGGKGVATTVGVALGIFPYFTFPMIVGLLGYAVVRFKTGMVAAGSIAIAVLFPAALGAYIYLDADMALAEVWPLVVVSGALGLLIILRHSANIGRMIRGEESGAGRTA